MGVDVFSFSDQSAFWTMMGVVVIAALWIVDRLTGAIRLLWRWFRRPKTARPAGPSFPKINPPPRERSLVGRKTELLRIRDLLATRQGVEITNTRGVALKADGGRGKTTLAREFAENYGETYGGGKWLRAQSRLTLLDDLAALGDGAFGMAIPSPVTEAHGLAVLDRIANSGVNWLLVYDNVDDHEDIKSLIAHGANVDVIVTTRLGLGWDGFGRIDLDVLDFATPDGDAVTLLLQEAGLAMSANAEMREQAREIAEALGGLPLALVMAGTVLREDGIGLPELRSEIARVIERTPHNANYLDSVAGAVMLTYGRLTEDGKALADLCAWLAPEGLSEGLFVDGVAGAFWSQYRADVSSDLATLIEDAGRVRGALQDLRRWSVLTGLVPWRMHRLTQSVLRAGQRDGRDWTMARAAAAVLAAQFPGGSSPPDLVANWPLCRALLPQVTALWDEAEPLWDEDSGAGGWGRPGWEAMDYLLNQAGIYLSQQADLPGAIALKRASLKLKDARLGEDHRDIPLALGNLAVDLAEPGAEADLDEAEALIARAVALDQAHRKGPAHSDLAATYMQQAFIALRRIEAEGGLAQGGPVATKAAELAEQALAAAWTIRAELSGENSAEITHVWNQTAYLRILQGRKAAGLTAYSRALEIARALPDGDRGDLAFLAHNAGSTTLELGRAKEAEALLREAYGIRRVIFEENPQHPLLAASTRWLAACLCKRSAQGVADALDEAKTLCARHGLPFDEVQAHAAELPPEPLDLPQDEDWPWSEPPAPAQP
ncbi:MAG: tetratricopeptide repeat protein [Salinarimonadaceae bacterium]|nr:MAG: tetratricopeptide repeat protein [Salinarimonadaceae bacterium]